MTTIQVDSSHLREFGRALGNADREVSRTFLAALSEAGELVATTARARASFSARIPGEISVRRAGTTVRVVAADSTGEAAALEHGGDEGTFRHPVFGNRDNWVAQQARPFLHPALHDQEAGVERIVTDAIDAALHAIGL